MLVAIYHLSPIVLLLFNSSQKLYPAYARKLGRVFNKLGSFCQKLPSLFSAIGLPLDFVQKGEGGRWNKGTENTESHEVWTKVALDLH